MNDRRGDSESMLRYHSMTLRRTKYDSPISQKDYGEPSEKFVNYCAGDHDHNDEYAERINRGFRMIGEEHHEKITTKSKYTACESWDHWDC